MTQEVYEAALIMSGAGLVAIAWALSRIVARPSKPTTPLLYTVPDVKPTKFTRMFKRY